jgi:iron complex outermembrane recepter protein
MPLYLTPSSGFLRILILFNSCFFSAYDGYSQRDSLLSADTVVLPRTLQNIRVRAFEHNRILRDVPASVSYLNLTQFQRFSSTSVVHAVNSSPGVRMEERSPGSYRFNIRGSSLRSPFGVRNIKVYFNDIPFTDPGGNTYLNQLGNYNFNSLEIIKGPGSSLYGSGTGGVLLIESLPAMEPSGLTAEYSTGSFGMHHAYGSYSGSNENYLSRFSAQHLQSNGYRVQSALKRNVFSWNGKFRLDEQKVLKSSFLYGDLFYETPGALNASEYVQNPKAARPGVGGFPGAVQARASIHQKTFLAGASLEQDLFIHLKNKTVLYGMFTQLINPNLRGYEKSSLPHVGGRTTFHWRKMINSSELNIDFGGEWQQGYQTIRVHDNIEGQPDSLRTSDDINNRNAMVFFQAVLDLNNGWSVVGASGMNWLKTDFTRFAPLTIGRQTRKFGNEIAPRFAIMKKFNDITLYSAVSKGFSPPSTTELLPTGGAINLDLQAEDGINYDLGVRALIGEKFTADLNTFIFRLNNTIVQRRDAGGGDYFINAGKTSQKGIELSLAYPVINHSGSRGFLKQGNAWLSYTYHHFRYKEFRQILSDYSGNKLPGVAPHTIAAGLDLDIREKFFLAVHYFYSDKIALNDANTEYAGTYHLLGFKATYYFPSGKKWKMNLMAGAENLFNQQYSLGNDINGFGGRYYNAASGRNYFAGLRLMLWNKNPS